jgi:Domain of unknown function (DUF397)
MAWRKSSYSGENQSSCVEVAATEPGVLVRDSKNVAGPVLVFPVVKWQAFLGGLG